MNKKIFTLVIMMALASIFVGCSAESDEDIALFLRVGTYTGTIAGTKPVNVEAVLSTTYNGGKISLIVDNTLNNIYLTKDQMTSSDTTLVVTYPMDITVVFDSPRKATGAIATFDIPTGVGTETTKVEVTLTKQ